MTSQPRANLDFSQFSDQDDVSTTAKASLFTDEDLQGTSAFALQDRVAMLSTTTSSSAFEDFLKGSVEDDLFNNIVASKSSQGGQSSNVDKEDPIFGSRSRRKRFSLAGYSMTTLLLILQRLRRLRRFLFIFSWVESYSRRSSQQRHIFINRNSFFFVFYLFVLVKSTATRMRAVVVVHLIFVGNS